jgi:phenol 2-monooxygenase
MVEDVFIEDMRERNIEVTRGSTFQEYKSEVDSDTVEIDYIENNTGSHRSFKTQYLVGCDGAHSNVRKSIPRAKMVGESSNAKWGVLDGTSFMSSYFSIWLIFVCRRD